MNNNILKQAAELFDTAEKWNAFVELVNQQENVKELWWNKLQESVCKRGTQPKWTVYKYDGTEKLIWYLSDAEQGKSSTSIYFDGQYICVYFYSGIDHQKAQELVKNVKFDKILNCFDNPEKGSGQYFLWENFKLKIDGEEISELDKLAWYAGNKTEEFANQLLEKIQKLQTVEITELFEEINKECKAQ
ncbi:hypothetical protein ACIRNY_01740 [Capnocytophaga canimorsus]|uniref:Uncharacterized protein n=1 Tax=Capnocytophaga canimorsus TaxID=28188 RepID=A0AAC9Z2Y4_9FLAO|nr:hypothetical protein [Capnocytophaga canimorsus]ATA93256.1 hypothetical protein CGC54_02325 [Capnocytophaga canimorsus]